MTSLAAKLAKEPDRLVRLVIEQLHDPVLLGSDGLDDAIRMLLERFCVSLQLSRAIGFAGWACREGARIGAVRASELVAATAHVIAGEATLFEVDHGRLLVFLEALKSELAASLSSCDDQAVEADEFSEATNALLAMLGERDSATCCHSKATGAWTKRLCNAMRIDKASSEFIELCAVLHDVGKIATPDRILFKRGTLTKEEWVIMRDHAAAGQRVLDQVPSLRRCSLVVRAHHERWDGAGYPDGLAGESIPFEARVVAVADAFHAMISERPYRKAIAPRHALEILRGGRGTQWDAGVVDVMLGLFDRSRRVRSERRASSA